MLGAAWETVKKKQFRRELGFNQPGVVPMSSQGWLSQLDTQAAAVQILFHQN